MRSPGAALTSTMPPLTSSSGRITVSATTSTPQMCRPTICAAAMARCRHLGVHVVGHVGGGAAGD
jgi:hypothetical protein